eukprot:4783369-Pyramimonas_sp.AAC.1
MAATTRARTTSWPDRGARSPKALRTKMAVPPDGQPPEPVAAAVHRDFQPFLVAQLEADGI